jgi:hypothetical protein
MSYIVRDGQGNEVVMPIAPIWPITANYAHCVPIMCPLCAHYGPLWPVMAHYAHCGAFRALQAARVFSVVCCVFVPRGWA